MACGLGIGCGSSKPPPSQQEIAVRQLLSDSNSRVWAKISNDGEYLTDKSLPGRLRFAVHGIRIRPTFLIPVANRTKWGGLEVVVSQIPALTELQVHRVPDFDDEALRRVGELQRLESLHIFGVPITDDGLRHISKLARLEELSFVSLTISGRGLSGLRHLKRLRLTRIRGDSMGGAAVSKLESLEELFVQGKSFNDDFVRHLTRLRLKKLVLSRCAITDDAIQSCVQIKTLEELSLPHSVSAR